MTRSSKTLRSTRIKTRLHFKQSGSGVDIRKWLGKVGIEFHLRGYLFIGPGTKLTKRLKRGNPGIKWLNKMSCEILIDQRFSDGPFSPPGGVMVSGAPPPPPPPPSEPLLDFEMSPVGPHHTFHFTMQSDAFTHAFQSTFTVSEFEEGLKRLDTYLQSLANKLNSNQAFEADDAFTIETTFIRTPTPGSGNGKRHKPSSRAVRRVPRLQLDLRSRNR